MDDWREAMTGVLSDNPNITTTDLFDLALNKMGNDGFETRGPKAGRNKNLRKMLDDDARFQIENGKVSLATANA